MGVDFYPGSDSQHGAVECGGRRWLVECDASDDVARLSLFPEVSDICIASCVSGGETDFLHIFPARSGLVWLLSCRSGVLLNHICLRKRGVPDIIDLEYVYADDQTSAISNSYNTFEEWMNDPDLLSAVPHKGGLLTVKVAPASLWFLRFPLGLYVRLRLGRFSSYQMLQWVVTQRTLAENATYRNALTDVVTDLAVLVDGTVIVLNEYESHLQEASKTILLRAVCLLEHLLRQYEEVYVDGKCLSLRWIKNPSALELNKLLLDQRTKLFFAGFEAGEGVWQLTDTSLQDKSAKPDYFDVGPLKGRLGHIFLLRIFHCNSIFNPYTDATRGGEPAGEHTIARDLLETDARFVEGGFTKESYFDFICSVILHLFDTSLRSVLEARQIEGKLQLTSVILECNEILRFRGYRVISD